MAWKEPEHKASITFQGPKYYCPRDEDHFFEWLKQIEGVIDVRGHATYLTVYLSVEHLSDSALRDVIGLFYRYNVPMAVLQSQLTSQNKHWFKNPDAFWYDHVFAALADTPEDADQELAVKVVWEDDHMIEIECAVHAENWAARSRAYTQRPQLAEFAQALKKFAQRCDGSASFEAGGEVIGSVSLRFYPYNKSKHLACLVQLSTSVSTDHRPEEISRASLEVRTERGLVDSFADELKDVADGLYNEACLRLVRKSS